MNVMIDDKKTQELVYEIIKDFIGKHCEFTARSIENELISKHPFIEFDWRCVQDCVHYLLTGDHDIEVGSEMRVIPENYYIDWKINDGTISRTYYYKDVSDDRS